MKDPMEVATGKSIEEAGKTARHLIDKLGAPAEELGLLIRDRISFWRFRQQVNLVVRAKTILEDKGVKIEQLASLSSPSGLISIIEHGSSTDDPDLREMFANLLVTEIINGNKAVHPSYAKALGELSPEEARMLHGLYRLNRKLRKETDAFAWRKEIPDGWLIKNEFYECKSNPALCVESLYRLGLAFQIPHPHHNHLTEFGWGLMLAVTGDDDVPNIGKSAKRNPFANKMDPFA